VPGEASSCLLLFLFLTAPLHVTGVIFKIKCPLKIPVFSLNNLLLSLKLRPRAGIQKYSHFRHFNELGFQGLLQSHWGNFDKPRKSFKHIYIFGHITNRGSEVALVRCPI